MASSAAFKNYCELILAGEEVGLLGGSWFETLRRSYTMPSFEKCAICSEMFREQYGATKENKCVLCMIADLRAANDSEIREREHTGDAPARAASASA